MAKHRQATAEIPVEMQELIYALAEVAGSVVPPRQCFGDLADRVRAGLLHEFQGMGTSCLSTDDNAECQYLLTANSYSSEACKKGPALPACQHMTAPILKALAACQHNIARAAESSDRLDYFNSALNCVEDMNRHVQTLALFIRALRDSCRS